MASYDGYGGDPQNITVAMWYTPTESRGVGVLVATGMLSLLSVITLITIMIVSAIRSIRSPEEHKFIRTHVAIYFFSLLLCDLAQGIGALLNTRWIAQGGLEIGSYCTAQAVIKQTGNVGTALWSFVIAVHTFDVLFLRWHIANYVCYGTLVGVWAFLGFIVILGPAVVESRARGPFYGISGYWCWITPAYPVERYALEYLFMFASAGLSFILYFLVFLRLRGNVSVSGWHIRVHRVQDGPGQDNSNNGLFHDGRRDPHLMQVARQMLWYPVAYSILVIPIAAARFSAFDGKSVPFAVTIFTSSIFMLSGFVNAILFTTTRRVIHFPSSWKSRWLTFSQRSNDSERGHITGPYISTTTMTQVDEPDSPTTRAPVMRAPQPFTNFNSPFAPPTHPIPRPPPRAGSLGPAQSAVSFGSQHGKRPQWAVHDRSGSEGSLRSVATLVIRDDPTAFSGVPLVKNASAEGRSGYPYVYGRQRSGSEGSIRHQAGYAGASGSLSSSRDKALPSLPPETQ